MGRIASQITPTACDLMCLANELESLKRLLQMEQENGFSPVCVRVWTVRALIWMNRFGQLLHPKGLCESDEKSGLVFAFKCPDGTCPCEFGSLFARVGSEMTDEIALADEALCAVVAAKRACRNMGPALDCSFRFWACLELVVLHCRSQLRVGQRRLPEVVEVRVGHGAPIVDCADQARVCLCYSTNGIHHHLSVRRSRCR